MSEDIGSGGEIPHLGNIEDPSITDEEIRHVLTTLRQVIDKSFENGPSRFSFGLSNEASLPIDPAEYPLWEKYCHLSGRLRQATQDQYVHLAVAYPIPDEIDIYTPKSPEEEAAEISAITKSVVMETGNGPSLVRLKKFDPNKQHCVFLLNPRFSSDILSSQLQGTSHTRIDLSVLAQSQRGGWVVDRSSREASPHVVNHIMFYVDDKVTEEPSEVVAKDYSAGVSVYCTLNRDIDTMPIPEDPLLRFAFVQLQRFLTPARLDGSTGSDLELPPAQ